MALSLRRAVFGKPIATERAHHERLNNFQALAVFASDAISSTAYATQEILLMLTLAGTSALHLSLPIAGSIAVLLVIVTISYQQTLFAYPNGGGAYIVAKDNLGVLPSQIAGASLLTDYILTVSVSIAAGIAAVTSAFPALHEHTVLLCLLAIGVIALGNLRGVRESGTIFAIPTYFFIVVAYLLLAAGFYRVFIQGVPQRPPQEAIHATQTLTLFLILRAFASGCAALTGIEAISNGIQAFRAPESKNASKTMISMSFVLTTVFLGITWLSNHYGIVYTHETKETVPSMLAEAIFGGRGTLYLAFQLGTMAILIMAANTAFADFPRLAALQAADGFLPRQLTNLGERLVFNNGIAGLTLLSSLLIIVFRGNTDHLIPLYAVGVFLSFTLSQFGMVVRWSRLRTPGWRLKALINGLGGISTGMVCLVIAMTKFMSGAWLIILVIPLMVSVFYQIHRHYVNVGDQLRLEAIPKLREKSLSKVLVLVPGVHKGSIPAVEFARSLSPSAIGFHVDSGRDPQAEADLKAHWDEFAGDMPLIIVHSPYREVVRPILEFLEVLKESGDVSAPVTVVLPEFVPRGWLNSILHNQTGLIIKWALLFRRDVVLCNVRYYLD
jgi:amino acid transporter